MERIVWSCWFQGRDRAPALVRKCLASWEKLNPGWELRCLDAWSVRRYVDFPDLAGKAITAASYSDIVRILLLKEYGGVWADATVLCNRPLDEWLPGCARDDFFAFDRPGPDRVLASWFLASGENNYLVDRWCEKTLAYWQARTRAERYFWFHGLFGELCEEDPEFAGRWRRVPKLSADGPHSVQHAGLFEKNEEKISQVVDWRSPVFKLTYRLDESRWTPETLIWKLLGSPADSDASAASLADARDGGVASIFASLKVSTNNLGDHIQILAGQLLLRRLGVVPSLHIDRDDEIASAAALPPGAGRVALLLNGWFKRNREQWPPHERIDPLFLGFHIRLFQCPELLSEDALRYYRRHGPVGCRDAYTRQLLASHGIECFESNCLSLAFPLRAGSGRGKVLVVSRDRHLLDVVPREIGPCSYVNHYTESFDFLSNMDRAKELLAKYAAEARLIVTTFLHCALPAIAMGIPVVAFYPQNDPQGQQSDRERFSSLERLVPVYRFDQAGDIDWNPRPVHAARHKLQLLDSFYALARRWQTPEIDPLGPFAPATELPPPDA